MGTISIPIATFSTWFRKDPSSMLLIMDSCTVTSGVTAWTIFEDSGCSVPFSLPGLNQPA